MSLGAFYSLLYANIFNSNWDGYLQNEDRWLNMLLDFLKVGDMESIVLNFGFLHTENNEIKMAEQRFENSEIDIAELTKDDILKLIYYFRLSLLCDIVKKLGDFEDIRNKIVKSKKNAFNNIKVGDTVFVEKRYKRDAMEIKNASRYKYAYLKRERDWVETKVINVKNNKGKIKIQVEYGHYWYDILDYPKYIRTTNNHTCSIMSMNETEKIEMGFDEIFNELSSAFN